MLANRHAPKRWLRLLVRGIRVQKNDGGKSGTASYFIKFYKWERSAADRLL
jgi:hypothetical protein